MKVRLVRPSIRLRVTLCPVVARTVTDALLVFFPPS